MLRTSAARAGELRGAQEVDLGAHERAHRAQEREQRVAARVAARGTVAAHEGSGEIVVAARDVHDEEREVVADVGDPELGVELDAVDRVDALTEQDVLGAQVAVAVADQSGRRATHELGRRSPSSAARQKRARSASRRAGASAAASVSSVSSTTAASRCAPCSLTTGAAAWNPATAPPTATRSGSLASACASRAASVDDSS